MEGNRHNFSKKRPNTHFKKKGGNKRGKWQNAGREQSSGNSHSSDTVYRILCPSKKIGGVIGKGGGIIKTLREETQAKITVADSVPGSDERVITIFSAPAKIPKEVDTNEGSTSENDDDIMELHCAAQDALLKVHNRIIEEDLFGGMKFEDENENTVVTARLLVPDNMVGCLLGKGGDVIQKLRSNTGASIRVLPADHLPTCAMSNDELVQISGKPDIVKKALHEVSTLLHQNPRKDKPPSTFPMPYRSQNFHPPRAPMEHMMPRGNPMWSRRNSPPQGMPPGPWMGGYDDHPHGFGLGGFDGVPPPGHSGEASGEFYIKMLCSSGRIGGVIGKGGINVRQLQQETGASIHVEDVSAESEERVIRVSSLEALWNPRSQTIEAILMLQNKTSELSEKGILTTRLLVPSSKVGCILGQGGHIINEMRRRTHADIRVSSKDDRPPCASEDEELVQISGNFGVAKDALAEIASRLRARSLRDANSGEGPAPIGPPIPGFGPPGSIPGGPSTPGAMGASSSGGYELLKGGRHGYERHSRHGYERQGGHEYDHEYERQSYPVPSTATGYPNVHNPIEAKVPNDAGGSVIGTGGTHIPNFGEVAGTRVKLQDPQASASECVVEIRGPPEHLNAAQNILHSISSYPSTDPYHGAYPKADPPPHHGAYANADPHHCAYPNSDPYRGSYLNSNPQQGSYPTMSAPPQGTYPGAYPQPGSYPNFSGQQGSYQY